MNILSYYLLNRTSSNLSTLNQDYVERLYQYYVNGGQALNYNININKENFIEIFNTIFDVLKLKIDNATYKIISEHYLNLLMVDANEGENVDIIYAINYLWYLGIGVSQDIDTKEYRDLIPIIQQQLIHKFQIKESIKEKVRRKIYTKSFITI